LRRDIPLHLLVIRSSRNFLLLLEESSNRNGDWSSSRRRVGRMDRMDVRVRHPRGDGEIVDLCAGDGLRGIEREGRRLKAHQKGDRRNLLPFVLGPLASPLTTSSPFASLLPRIPPGSPFALFPLLTFPALRQASSLSPHPIKMAPRPSSTLLVASLLLFSSLASRISAQGQACGVGLAACTASAPCCSGE